MNKLLLLSVILTSCGPISRVDYRPSADEVTVMQPGQPSLEALFHPVDPTLERIAELIKGPYSRIDLAMYNMEDSNKSPVVKALASAAVQRRIEAGDLAVRIIFQGYGGRQGPVSINLEEDLGVDVRHIVGSRDVHHKFGVFDGHAAQGSVVSGSANWSLSSYTRYDENMIFAIEYPGLAQAFQGEFDKLWASTKAFNRDLAIQPFVPADNFEMEEGLEVYFNSDNFVFSPTSIKVPRGQAKLYTLTRNLVSWIDRAESSLKIASTRINLRPVYDAILRAAARGVQIQIISNQDQYSSPHWRSRWELKSCQAEAMTSAEKACCSRSPGVAAFSYDSYEKSCSTSQIHGYFLSQQNFSGNKNVSVRVKLFSLSPNRQNSLLKQMHAKYTIIDDQYVLAGSFNYSVSSEYNHYENVMLIDGAFYPDTVGDFIDHFSAIYQQGRDHVLTAGSGLQSRLEVAHRNKSKTTCDLDTVSMSYDEIDFLLNTKRRIANEEGREDTWSKLTDACE